MLKEKGYDYLCVTRSGLKDYHADIESTPVLIKDKRDHPIELINVMNDIGVGQDTDQYLPVKSHAKALKENSMNGLFSQRSEQCIEQINAGDLPKVGPRP